MIQERQERFHQKENLYSHIQSVVRVGGYEPEALDRAVERHFTALGVASDLYDGIRMLLKPNLISAKKPETAATTHPALLGAVVRWLRAHGVENIVIADSPGGPYTPEALRNIYHVCGLTALRDCAQLNLNVEYETVYAPNTFANPSFSIIRPVAEADYIINMPKLKTHAMTGMSGGIKNLFGSVPGLQKAQLHYRWKDLDDFSMMLVELACVVAPEITLIDAIDAMEGDGPTGGDPIHSGVTFAARDLYTQDYLAAQFMKLEPEEIGMLRAARSRGLLQPERVIWANDPLPSGQKAYAVPQTKKHDFTNHVPAFLSKPFGAAAERLLRSYPVLDAERCVGCMKCAEICPAQIIGKKDGRPVFTKKKCISCFCCQEMCPMNAIQVKKAL